MDDNWRDSIRAIIDEAMSDFNLENIAIRDAMSQAVFRAVGYTERRVLEEANKRMTVKDWNDLLREVKK